MANSKRPSPSRTKSAGTVSNQAVRARAVWISFMGAMTVVGGLLLLLDAHLSLCHLFRLHL
jgi:hypothetical protein